MRDQAEVAAPRRPVFGLVRYDEDAHEAMAWVARVVSFVVAVSSWAVGPQAGLAATMGCVVLCAATWLIRPVAFRLVVVALALFVPLGTVIIPQITHNNRVAAQAEADRVAAEKPYTDAVNAVKTELKNRGFNVDTLSLDRNDMTRGEADLTFHVQRTTYAKVILIYRDGRWTVNCSAEGGPIDITADGNRLAVALNATGRCPAGLKKSAPTP